MEKTGWVYLVGAGCGEADLITLRGMALLRNCDAVVYDDLISKELLDAVPPQAEKIYMGKRSGHHSAAQKEICAVLIRLAKEGKSVVRLKGGDPFIFGRGGEEALALQQAGVPCQVVPGISSAIAIPAWAGIPVTCRGVSQSVHIVTAHTADTPDGLPAYFDRLAALPGTLVFLMGLSRLERITRRLTEAGLSPDTPAAVVSGGNAPSPVTVRGTLEDIACRARKAAVHSPAVIVVGRAAALDCSSVREKPLHGVVIGLTGTQSIQDRLGPALRDQGARVFAAQRSVVEELPLKEDLRAICCGAPYWIVFTSRNGVRLFFDNLSRQGVDLRQLHACRFAVIGKSTEDFLKTFGIYADLCPARYTSQGLAQVLRENVGREEPIYLFRSRLGSAVLPEALQEYRHVRDIPLYTLRSHRETEESAGMLLDTADYLTFSSASGVELYFQAHGSLPQGTTCVCIGEVTARALRKRSDKPFLTAGEISARGVVQAIIDHHCGE